MNIIGTESANSNGHAATNGNAPSVAWPDLAVDTRAGATAANTTPSRVGTSLIIPARNEARNITWVLEQVPDCVDEVLLVDGSSRDATLLMARLCMPKVRVVAQRGPGKGSALRTGFEEAVGERIVMMDADGSMSPQEIPRYLHFLDNGYDFVKGSRFVAGGGSQDITPLRRLGNLALVASVKALYRTTLTDLCYGFCAFRRCFLDHLDLQAEGFEIETEMVLRALQSGLRIAEVPSLELPRRSGKSNLHTFRDGARVLRTVLAERDGAARGGQPARSRMGSCEA
jgi:glycosyltransferase involved in cell wall biosynthesis